jgi:outer membrane murein-binding lipoprotein Lpp
VSFWEQVGPIAAVVVPCVTGLGIVLSGKINTLTATVTGLDRRLQLVEEDVRALRPTPAPAAGSTSSAA